MKSSIEDSALEESARSRWVYDANLQVYQRKIGYKQGREVEYNNTINIIVILPNIKLLFIKYLLCLHFIYFLPNFGKIGSMLNVHRLDQRYFKLRLAAVL